MKYNEIENIGQGSFAKVYLVKDNNNIEYAKKVFSPDSSLIENIGKEQLTKRFIREIKYQNTLNHRNIVQIVDTFLEENPPYFIMPLAQCTLKDEMNNDHTLGENLKLALFDILAGLEAIHDNGFTHRDLKPANILKFYGNGGIKYAISDFGLITSNHSESSALTATGAAGGTENYAAPELNGGFGRANFAADIYSFGAILHDIFGNRATRIPYTELTLSNDFGNIISKCTKRLPIKRYSSVRELREELYSALNKNNITFNSSNEKEVVDLLIDKTTLSDEEWDILFIFINDCMNTNISCDNVYKVITAEHIQSLKNSPELFNDLGNNFCQYMKDGVFDFDYCDILAIKAELFYEGEDLGLKSNAVIALLELGTRHNRWYVEQKYMSMVDRSISDVLAKRIKIELEIQEIDFKNMMSHIEHSISVSKNTLHPILLDLIS